MNVLKNMKFRYFKLVSIAQVLVAMLTAFIVILTLFINLNVWYYFHAPLWLLSLATVIIWLAGISILLFIAYRLKKETHVENKYLTSIVLPELMLNIVSMFLISLLRKRRK